MTSRTALRAPLPPLPSTTTRRAWLASVLKMGIVACGVSGLNACNQSDDPIAQASPANGGGSLPSIETAAAERAVAAGLMGVAIGWIDAQTEPDITSVAVRGLRQAGGLPMQPTDDWYFGSTAKAMTAMVVARLVEKGLLDWGLTVAQCMPEVAAHQHEAYANVTLAQWLDHLGGVVPMNGAADDEARFMADLPAAPNLWPDTAHGRRVLACQWVLSQAPQPGIRPGVDYVYSNAGYMIAATMVEAVTSKDFETLLQQELAQPLGMDIRWPLPSQRPHDAVVGHQGQAFRLHPVQPLDPQEELWLQCLAPSGFWTTTPLSMARWGQAVLAALLGKPTPLPAQAIRRLQQLQPDQYALGWKAVALPDGIALWHNGDHHGCMSEVVVHPGARWAAFGMTNTEELDMATGQSWVASTLDQALHSVVSAHRTP